MLTRRDQSCEPLVVTIMMLINSAAHEPTIATHDEEACELQKESRQNTIITVPIIMRFINVMACDVA